DRQNHFLSQSRKHRYVLVGLVVPLPILLRRSLRLSRGPTRRRSRRLWIVGLLLRHRQQAEQDTAADSDHERSGDKTIHSNPCFGYILPRARFCRMDPRSGHLHPPVTPRHTSSYCFTATTSTAKPA